MSLQLAEISARVTLGKHCALLVDQAGWHVSERLAVPSNITIVPLPPLPFHVLYTRNLQAAPPAKCPELNSVESV